MKYYSFNPKITKKDLEQAQAVSDAYWYAYIEKLINEKENKMAKAKYDVGDILTWCKDGECYATAVIVRWHTKSMYVEGISLEQHTDYDVFVKSHEKDDFELAHGVPECAFCNYKVVGHIDISGMPNDEVKTHLDCAIATVWSEYVIAYAVQTHWELMKLRESKEENKYVKKEFYIPKMTDEYCCWNGYDKLAEENRRLKEEIGSQNDKIFALQKELNRRRDKEVLISRNLHNLGFTSDAVYKIMYSE